MNAPLAVSAKDTAIIEDELDRLRCLGYIECLEWGAGGSTFHFPSLLERRGVPYRWTSLEHDIAWRDRVAKATEHLRVECFLFPRQGDADPMTDYIEYPLRMRRRFDFVFVDGRKRRRCLITAAKVAAPGGVVVLHDAHRQYYHSAFSHFTAHEFIGDDLWIGRIDVG